jgi:hypothetical protein
MSYTVTTQHILLRYARWLLFLLSLYWLAGCDPYQDEKRKVAKYQAAVNPENGRIVEVNGQEFRIVYIGGMRFRFPNTNQFRWNGSFATSSSSDGVSIYLLWPDIQSGKSPETKFMAMEGDIGRNNNIEVQVRGKDKPVIIDKNKEFGLPYYLNPDDYIIRDDLELGLRKFVSKSTSKELIDKGSFDYAHSLTNDATEPWSGRPIVVSRGFINFMYAPKVSVRIITMGIPQDWKGIYLRAIETLNKYREDN